MGSDYKRVFEPLTIKGVEFKNRIICTPNVCGWGSREGVLTAEQSAYYERIASGGAAAVTLGNCSVNMKETSDEIHQLDMSSDKVIFGLNNLRERVASYNGILSAQLNYCGRNGWNEGSVYYAPSAIPSPGALERAELTGIPPQEVFEMSPGKIQELIDLYANAALRLKRAGFKMLQVHCAHNNLIGQFFSPISNFRTDQYGNRSLEDRARFGIEVLKAIRAKVGEGMLIDIRFSGEDVMPGGLQQDEAVAIGKLLEPHVDLFTISCAFHAHPSYIADKTTLSYLLPQLTLEEYTKPFRKALKRSKLVFTTNVVNLDNAEHILSEGIADFVGMFRPFLADTDIIKKYARNQVEDVRQCIRCEYHWTFMDFMPITCAVNPLCGREVEFPQGKVPRTDTPRKVLVVGSGPAGLQATLTAAERGHTVTLVEQDDHLGGNLIKAADVSFKSEFKKYVNWIIPRVEKSGARILLNTEATAAFVEQEVPDALILAVGSEDIVPPIPGVDKPLVHFSWQADNGSVEVGKNVVIIGAGLVGMESALALARDGHAVTVVEMLPEGSATGNLGIFAAPLKAQNKEAGTTVLYDTQVTEIKDVSVLLKGAVGGVGSTGAAGAASAAGAGGAAGVTGTTELKADTVLLAAGLRPRRSTVEALRHTIAEGDVYQVGDLTGGGTIGHATNSAFFVAAHL
ncbi:MAG: NAD(P)/FAD-dependent oxidoreductase [Coriobacteriales bacterium]|jgi:2,4-dienoyl-CoA reductase-like NADH-dependent reductase (Old Yellow Enzyme family)/thioredoxin reductase|nr:NAD(P)/FAD-dependent oxidoreductase [Coriobacteriales bacterium]